MEKIVSEKILLICKKAKEASRRLAMASGKERSLAISLMQEKLMAARDALFLANQGDAARAEAAGLTKPLLKRLQITDKVFKYMTDRIAAVAELDDPVGRILEGHTSPEGLVVQKVSVPLGVIALIYESRPNVTTDAASVCLKSGNAVILRGGSETLETNIVLARAMQEAVAAAGLPADSVQLITDPEHALVSELLAMDKYIDVVIPRGGKELIKRIAEGTNIPVIKHYEGICHMYIADDAPLQWALDVTVNSKCQSVEVCNALETLLIDKKAAAEMLPRFYEAFTKAGVELRGCAQARGLLPRLQAATEEDWYTEYLAPVLSVKIVEGIAAAVQHINTYGSGHTDGIITASLDKAHYFVNAVDSASVLVNASTRLSGGEAYGLGAVVGISTDKIHARGPVGPRDLCSYKWVAYGQGHLRK